MTENTGFPSPEANREQWLRDHPGAEQVTQEQAAGQVAAHLGGAAPDPGVTGEDLGQQMAAQGAHAGLPYEDQMNALMDQVKRLSEQLGGMQVREQQREAAAIAALGEPILQRYANYIRDALAGHQAASPGLGPDHFGPVRAHAEKLSAATADAVSKGANDLGTVRYYAGQIEHFLSAGHKRKAPAHLAHIDMSAIGQALEYLVEEADRLAPMGAVMLAG